MVTEKNTIESTDSKKIETQKNTGIIGKIIQFRRGRKTFKPKHFLIEIPGIDSREKATEFVGKTTEWTSTGKNAKVIKGKISSAHGGNGVVRAIFERGLPGQAIGTDVEVKE